MNEMEEYKKDVQALQEGGKAPVQYVSQEMSPLVAYAQEVKAAGQIASTIGNTSFVPGHFRGKTAELASAILYGQDLGLPVMHSMRSLYSIHGTPAMYADTMLAVAQSKGHEIERVEATEQVVKYRARRYNAKSGTFGEWQEVTWTMQRAERNGYTSNKKYKTSPIEMLTAKAKAEAARLVAADALMGLYSVEDMELENGGAEEGAQATKKPRKTIQRRVNNVSDPSATEPAPNGVGQDHQRVPNGGEETGADRS